MAVHIAANTSIILPASNRLLNHPISTPKILNRQRMDPIVLMHKIHQINPQPNNPHLKYPHSPRTKTKLNQKYKHQLKTISVRTLQFKISLTYSK